MSIDPDALQRAEPPRTCPDDAVLRRLLDDVEDGQDADFTAHLQRCEHCQRRLESLAAGGDSWSEASGLLSLSASSAEPGLKRAIARLEGRRDEQQESEDDTDLSFLSPARRPGCLGSLDHYDILSVVGRGGMGIVLKAHDTLLERVVAVKVMAPSLAASAEARQRFIREAQAAAAVAHEHVVTIHAVEPKNIPYLVMQFVAGTSLEEKIRAAGPLEAKEILRIGMQTAAGLTAAHAQGLIHRDIKPANILLENGVQRVKITDFGLARLVQEEGATQTGVIAGTPQYMSPEQARGDKLDYRADLFSLGSVLYAMCAGQSPFRASTVMAVLRKIADEESPALAELNPAIPRELIATIEKLHRKQPANRIQSAAEVAQSLASQLARLQAGEAPLTMSDASRQPAFDAPEVRPPVRSPSGMGKLAPWLLAVSAISLAVAAGAYYFARRAAPGEASLFGEADPVKASAIGAAQRMDLAPLSCVGHTAPVNEVVFSPDGATLASAGEDRAIRLWDARTGEPGHVLYGHQAPIHALAISPSGELLVSASDDGQIRFWDLATGQARKATAAHSGLIYALAISPDGETLASAGADRKIRLWGLKSSDQREFVEQDRIGFIRRLAFSPDGKTLVSAGEQISFWDMHSGQPRSTVPFAAASGLRFDHRNRFVAAASWQTGVIALLDPTDGHQLALWQSQEAKTENLALHSRCDLLMSVGQDGVARAWDPMRQELKAKWAAHAGHIYASAFAANAPILATAGASDFTVKIWDLSPLVSAPALSAPQSLAVTPLKHTLAGHRDSILDICFTSDGATLASASKDKTVRLWSTHTGQLARTLEGHAGEVVSVAVSPDHRLIASCGGDDAHGEVLLWDAKEQRQIDSLPAPEWQVLDVAFNHDGSLLASVGFGNLVKIYDVAARAESVSMESGQPALTRRVSFTADGQKLVTCGDFLNVYDLASKSRLFAAPHIETSDMKLSPRGDLLAAGEWNAGKITLYNFETMEPLSSWQAHRALLEGLAFSPDGRFLASTGGDRLLKIWELPSRRLRAIVFSPHGGFYAVAFSPDGQTLATSENQPDYNIYLWDVSALY